MQIKKDEGRRVVNKFQMKRVPRSSNHEIYRFYHPKTGRFAGRAKISFGKGEMTVPDKFRKELHLTEEQMREAIRCPFGLEDWLRVLEDKNVL